MFRQETSRVVSTSTAEPVPSADLRAARSLGPQSAQSSPEEEVTPKASRMQVRAVENEKEGKKEGVRVGGGS